VSLRTGGSLKEIPVAVKDALNATGTAPIYAARAWVNFDGTTAPATVIGSGNISSVARTSTGRYEANFTTAMQDSNYNVVGSVKESNSSSNAARIFGAFDYTTTSFKINTVSAAPSLTNNAIINATVVR
jgi:hypothetical protein